MLRTLTLHHCRYIFIVFIIHLLTMSNSFANGYTVTDSFGKHRLEKTPQRIVVTDWNLLEQMLELGVEPIGAPELELYRHYVHQPTLPNQITDIGLRRSPNLQTIKNLKPDLIIVGTDQKSLARPFSHIAPVMYYKNFSDKYRTNGKKTRERFLQIADLFQKRSYAENKLSLIDKEIETIKKQIHQHFNDKPPKLTLIRFSSDKKCLVYGKNSIPLYTTELLGMQTGIVSKRSKWGEKEIPIDQLDDIKQGVILYIQPVQNTKNLFSSQTWLSLKAVRSQRIYPMKPTWSYGGAMSVVYNARAIRDSLLAIPNLDY